MAEMVLKEGVEPQRDEVSRPVSEPGRRRQPRFSLPEGRSRPLHRRVARLIELDGELLRKVVSARRSPFTFVMRALCRMHDPDILILLVTALLFCGAVPTRIADHMAAALLLTSALVVIVKRTVRRARPAGDFQALTPPDRFSFPSGHTAASFALAIAMFGAAPLLAPVVVLVAVLVGYARMYLGVHYPIDVLAGACIGVFTGSLIALW